MGSLPPDEIRAMRLDLGLTQSELAQVLGYKGNAASAAVLVSNYEKGARELTRAQERLLQMYHTFGLPKDWTPERAQQRFRRDR